MGEQLTEIVCVRGADVVAHITIAEDQVDASIEQLNRQVAGAGLVWRRPITYREPLDAVCQGCGQKHSCSCPTTRADLRAEHTVFGR
jgi:hypothetical protein